MIKGSCLCKQCCYEATGDLFEVLNCHCSNCRKMHGSVFATYGGVNLNSFKWVCDSENIEKYKSSNIVTRYFCRNCSSLLASIDSTETDTIYLSLGGIDTDIQVEPQYHQFVAYKAAWHVIDDDLPQFAGKYLD